MGVSGSPFSEAVEEDGLRVDNDRAMEVVLAVIVEDSAPRCPL